MRAWKFEQIENKDAPSEIVLLRLLKCWDYGHIFVLQKNFDAKKNIPDSQCHYILFCDINLQFISECLLVQIDLLNIN